MTRYTLYKADFEEEHVIVDVPCAAVAVESREKTFSSKVRETRVFQEMCRESGVCSVCNMCCNGDRGR